VRLTAILLTIGVAIFIVISFTLVLAGPTLAERVARWFSLGPVFEWGWKILQWPVVFLLVSVGIALVYYFAPDAKTGLGLAGAGINHGHHTVAARLTRFQDVRDDRGIVRRLRCGRRW
jgi:uncharacterized BrkB/YihY/UPF0761 family membrane protein